MTKIVRIFSQEILDSNNTPTIKTSVYLDDGSEGTISVPSGTSKGTSEVVELRDGDRSRYKGLGVLKAVENVKNIIFPSIKNIDPYDQSKIDELMIRLDGTETKEVLGGNAILSVSLAIASASASSLNLPFFKYVGHLYKHDQKNFRVPTPMINLIEGGKHAEGGLDFQEFLAIPSTNYSLQTVISKVYKLLNLTANQLKRQGLRTNLGMEGGYAVNLAKNEDAIKLLKEVNFQLLDEGRDFFFGLDIAASSIYKDGKYILRDIQSPLEANKFINYLEKLAIKHNLFSLEDPLNETDLNGWQKLNSNLSKNTLIIGDDLTATNVKRLDNALANKTITGVVVKPNQIGTLSETINFTLKAQRAGLKIVVSHRSGETKDHFIADVAVGLKADYIKVGSPLKEERRIKFNRLLDIEKSQIKEIT